MARTRNAPTTAKPDVSAAARRVGITWAATTPNAPNTKPPMATDTARERRAVCWRAACHHPQAYADRRHSDRRCHHDHDAVNDGAARERAGPHQLGPASVLLAAQQPGCREVRPDGDDDDRRSAETPGREPAGGIEPGAGTKEWRGSRGSRRAPRLRSGRGRRGRGPRSRSPRPGRQRRTAPPAQTSSDGAAGRGAPRESGSGSSGAVVGEEDLLDVGLPGREGAYLVRRDPRASSSVGEPVS